MQTTAPYTPQQNGRAERLNSTLMEKVPSMLYGSKLSTRMWSYAVVTANYLRNRSPVRDEESTPFERFYGLVPGFRLCRVRSHARSKPQLKLEPWSIKGGFVGYETASKAYRVLLPSGKLMVSRDVLCQERTFGLEDYELDMHVLVEGRRRARGL